MHVVTASAMHMWPPSQVDIQPQLHVHTCTSDIVANDIPFAQALYNIGMSPDPPLPVRVGLARLGKIVIDDLCVCSTCLVYSV